MSPWTLNLEGIVNHEYWRLWTAHLYHYDWVQLLLNLAAMLPPVILIPRRLKGWLPLWSLCILPLISLALLRVPGLDFRGSSAYVMASWALAGALLMRLHRNEDRIWGTVLIALLVLKIASEMAIPGSGTYWRSQPLAHQVGAVLGLISGLIWPLKRTLKIGPRPAWD